jgi:hypothetical protein
MIQGGNFLVVVGYEYGLLASLIFSMRIDDDGGGGGGGVVVVVVVRNRRDTGPNACLGGAEGWLGIT